MSEQQYNSDAIEVLNGLDPVKRRPGMYTDTTRPNHLGQEIIDNSVDEALAGFASSIQIVLHEDHSLEVVDDGRGMPIDIHPEEGVSGVELILCKLHAGGKFSGKNYAFSGGLHGVGISVVNALSTRVEVTIRRDAKVYTKLHLKTAIRLKIFVRQGLVVNAIRGPVYVFGLMRLTLILISFLFHALTITCAQSRAMSWPQN